MLTFAIDRDSPIPLYEQVKDHLTRQITHGVLAPHTRLPSTRDLASQLGVARISVVTAYEDLKEEGYLVAQVGRGTFVAERPHPEAQGAAALAGSPFSQDASLRRLLHLAERPGVLHFGTGTPPDSFLPVDLIRSAINGVLLRDGTAAIAYEAPEGNPDLRRAVAKMLAPSGIQVTADEVLITGGCQQALDLAVQALLNPGDVVLTSSPTYAGFLDILQARGMAPIGVPVDAYGMRTDLLEAFIVEHRPRLLYVAPTYHNPTGTVMPLHRRRELLDIAATYHLPVLEDGVYQDMTYVGSPPPPLKALDEADLVLHASSFSKVMMPGMRIGYLITGERLQGRITRVKRAADVCTPALNQRAMSAILGDGSLGTHLERVRASFVARRSAMLGALSEMLPEATWPEPKGGLYVWVAIPKDGPTVTELFIHAVQKGVAFAPGPLFHPDGDGAHHLRLNMAAHPPEDIREGVGRLAAAWRELAHSYEVAPQRGAPLL